MKKLLTPLIIFIIIAACDDSPSGPAEYDYDDFKILDNQREGVIMPLATGNKWVYENWKLYPDGTINEEKQLDSIVVVNSVDTLEGPGYILNGYVPGIDFVNYPISNKVNGLWFLVSGGHLKFKYPIKKGEKWKYSNPIIRIAQSKDTTKWENKFIRSEIVNEIVVTSVSEQIKTPLQDFKSVVYKKHQKVKDTEELEGDYYPVRAAEAIITSYLVPDIGIVKIEIYWKEYNMDNFYLRWVSELTHYELY